MDDLNQCVNLPSTDHRRWVKCGAIYDLPRYDHTLSSLIILHTALRAGLQERVVSYATKHSVHT